MQDFCYLTGKLKASYCSNPVTYDLSLMKACNEFAIGVSSGEFAQLSCTITLSKAINCQGANFYSVDLSQSSYFGLSTTNNN